METYEEYRERMECEVKRRLEERGLDREHDARSYDRGWSFAAAGLLLEEIHALRAEVRELKGGE